MGFIFDSVCPMAYPRLRRSAGPNPTVMGWALQRAPMEYRAGNVPIDVRHAGGEWILGDDVKQPGLQEIMTLPARKFQREGADFDAHASTSEGLQF